jgi:uncharacterized protein
VAARDDLPGPDRPQTAPSLEQPGPVARALLVLLTGYRRLLSPLLGPRCRFAPSCSAYAVTAVQRFGAARGSWLALRRLVRCHPFHPGGHDPVPPARPRGGSRGGTLAAATSTPTGAPASPGA